MPGPRTIGIFAASVGHLPSLSPSFFLVNIAGGLLSLLPCLLGGWMGRYSVPVGAVPVRMQGFS
jgi:hypothetical protein